VYNLTLLRNRDAADLVKTIFDAVAYLHRCGIVHRDLKPENLLFKDPKEDADIMICDFGLSRVMESDKMALLTEICGTPGVSSWFPELLLVPAKPHWLEPILVHGARDLQQEWVTKISFRFTWTSVDWQNDLAGHHKPVDVWAMGVITYFLLCGYTPFDRDSQAKETEAILAGDYKFEPAEYWENVSETAKEFIRCCLTLDPVKRPTAKDMLDHKWLSNAHHAAVSTSAAPDLLPQVKKNFDAKRTCKFFIFSPPLITSHQPPLI
jgi:calcium/calmodulin-dependent protein kinase I